VSVPPQVTRTRARPAAWVTVAALVMASLVVLLGVGVRTGFDPQLDLDAAVSEALYAGDHRARALDWLLEVLTAPGLFVFRLVLALPVFVLLVRVRRMRLAAWVVAAAVLVAPLTTALKEYFGRVRPDFDAGGARYDSLSYPSGHSSGVATLVCVALVLSWPLLSSAARRLWVAAGVALVLLVGLTRMWLGVHFLSDVVGGWSLGISWTLVTALLFGALPGGPAALSPGNPGDADSAPPS
jgi:membrane-associated phospholipid phosphatase